MFFGLLCVETDSGVLMAGDLHSILLGGLSVIETAFVRLLPETSPLHRRLTGEVTRFNTSPFDIQSFFKVRAYAHK